jgi:quercetin dioxygenase-like cupin family protein
VKTAPKDAVTVQVKVWPLGGPAFRQATFPKGANFLPPKGPTDTLVYMVKGRMKVTLGDVTAEVGPGDAFRKMGDQRNNYQVIEETVILETDYTRPAAK